MAISGGKRLKFLSKKLVLRQKLNKPKNHSKPKKNHSRCFLVIVLCHSILYGNIVLCIYSSINSNVYKNMIWSAIESDFPVHNFWVVQLIPFLFHIDDHREFGEFGEFGELVNSVNWWIRWGWLQKMSRVMILSRGIFYLQQLFVKKIWRQRQFPTNWKPQKVQNETRAERWE